MEKGKDFSELPELYMIFIFDFDPFDLKRNHYEIKEYVEGSEVCYNDGAHRLYFNTKIKDESGLSKLLQYLADSNIENDNFGALSRHVNYHKIQNEGVDFMCKAVEEYAKSREEKGKIEAVKNMLKKDMAFETALELVRIDRQTYDKYAANEQ